MPYKDPKARQAAARKRYREKYKDKYREERKANKARSAARNRAYVDELKQAPCTDCGNTFPTVCMDFDHLPEFPKLADVCELVADGRALQRVQEEIDKCELVCANCHRIRTHTRRNGVLV